MTFYDLHYSALYVFFSFTKVAVERALIIQHVVFAIVQGGIFIRSASELEGRRAIGGKRRIFRRIC